MPLQIKTPLERQHKLDLADPTGETTVTIRQATQAAQERRAELFSVASRIVKDGIFETEIKQRISLPEVQRVEAFLTLTDCNILGEDGKSLFTFAKSPTGQQYLNMTELQFKEAWGKLPVTVAAEICSKVIEENPSWGSSGE